MSKPNKIKKFLSDLSTWVLTGIILLGILLIYVGVGGRGRRQQPGEFNIYFVGIGIALLIPFVIWFIKLYLRSKKIEKENETEIHRLIGYGERVPVDLDTVEILTNSYLQEIQVDTRMSERNEHIAVNHNVVLMKIPYKDTFIRYRLNIDMDPVKLKMHFAIKGKTTLYVDPNNPNNNHLDLSFLERR